MKSSRVEIKICDILDAAGLEYKEEYSFPDLVAESGRALRFDFAVFDDYGDIDFLIEYQGIQHYSPVDFFGGEDVLLQRKELDEQKRTLCEENGVRLIEWPYDDQPTDSNVKKQLSI